MNPARALAPLFVILLLLAARASAAPSTAHTVTTALGSIKGAACTGHPSVTAYLGIPYSKPPVGSLRFAAPVKYNTKYPKEGYDATYYRDRCVQPGLTEGLAMSEDCLHLNVWAPVSATPKSKLPVRVFIHGGGFITGSGNDQMYSGCAVSNDSDVITVTINYRLSVFGFLALPDLKDFAPTTPAVSKGTVGNWGVMDMRAALQWVRTNINAFGGDPKHVFLFGESAGCWGVVSQLLMPSSKGLFSSAGCESEGIGMDLAIPLSDAYRIGRMFGDAVGCNKTSARAAGYRGVKHCLQSVTTEAVLSVPGGERTHCHTLQTVAPLLDVTLFFRATVDDVEFRKPALALIKSGAFHKVPLAIGINRYEGSLFILGDSAPYLLAGQDIPDDLILRLSWARQYIPEDFRERLMAQYNNVVFSSNYEAGVQYYGDFDINCDTYRTARAFADKGMPVYAYAFTQPPTEGCIALAAVGAPALGNPAVWSLLNSTHGAELPFVHNSPADPSDPILPYCNYTAEERTLSTFWSGAWTTLAATAKSPLPSTSRSLTDPRFKSLKASDWPRFNTKTLALFDMNYYSPGPSTWNMTELCDIWDDMLAYRQKRGTYYFLPGYNQTLPLLAQRRH